MNSTARKVIAQLLSETTQGGGKPERAMARLLAFASNDPQGYREWVDGRTVLIDALKLNVSFETGAPAWSGEVTVTAPDGVTSQSLSVNVDELTDGPDDLNLARAIDTSITLAGLRGAGGLAPQAVGRIHEKLENLLSHGGASVRLSPDGTIK